MPLQSQQKPLFWLVSVLVFCFPVLAIVVKHSDGVIFVLLTILGLLFATFQQKNVALSKDEKLLFFAIGFFFLAALVSVLLGHDPMQGDGKLSKFLRLLLLVPVYFLFRKLKLSEAIFWYGLVCGGVFAGLVSIYETVYGPIYEVKGHRAHGATHPILFGNLSLAMGFMALASIGYIRQKNLWLIILPVAALVLGIAASFLSGSRGGWLALPVLIILLLWFIRNELPRKAVTGVSVVLVVTLVVVYLVPGTGVAKRINVTVKNLTAYGESAIDSPMRATSVGTRLEMWQASWMIFKEHPVLGVGWGNYKANAKKLVEQGKRNKSAAYWGHPHNEYFAVLASGGLLGFAALLILFIMPLRYFYRATKSESGATRALGIAGVMLVVAYMHFALSEAIFERALPVTFYVFFVALITALIVRRYELAYEDCPQRKQSLSVTIIAMNEADRIERGLKSVAGWADEIIVFDSGSTDNTVEIARRYTDKVFVTDWPGYGPQKQRALEKATCDWVFSLDADEELTPELRCDIDRALNDDPDADAYRTPWAVTIFGKRLDFGRSARAPKRLFRRQGARFSDHQVHEHVILPKGNNKVKTLKGRLIHYTHRDFGHYLEKSARYAWLGGQRRYDSNKKGGGLVVAVLRAFWNFVLIYFIRLGMLDGRVGFLVAVMYAQSAFNKYASLWTIRRMKNLGEAK